MEQQKRRDRTRAKVDAPDRFESVGNPRRVGVHRASEEIGSPRIKVLLAFLVTLLLSTLGILFIQLQPGSVKYSQEQGSARQQTQTAGITGELNPEATVAVLNGTELSDLAFFVDDAIAENEWGTVIFSGDDKNRAVLTTAVFYSDEKDAPAAVALGEKLGGAKAYLNAEYVKFSNQLTVLLGADYSGPGFDKAKAGNHSRGQNVEELSHLEFEPDSEFEPGLQEEFGEFGDEPYEEDLYLE